MLCHALCVCRPSVHLISEYHSLLLSYAEYLLLNYGNQMLLKILQSPLNLLSNAAMYPAEDNEFITPELFQTYMKALYPELTYIAKHIYTRCGFNKGIENIYIIRQKKPL